MPNENTNNPPGAGATPPTGSESGAGGATETVETLKAKLEASEARIKELNTESKTHRLAAKAAKEEAETLKAKSGATPTPEEKAAADAKASADLKLRRMLVKTALVAETAKEAHDVHALYAANSSRFEALDVDLDKETVDTKALKELVADIKKTQPFFFVGAKSGAPAPQPKPGEKPPDNGAPAGGADHYSHWRSLVDGKRAAEAQDYYAKNRPAILAQMGRNGRSN